jgi:exodeoxyribonuclease VII small subunit
MTETELNFEDSFKRLEEILEKLNSSKISLDESLKLFEEANHLITKCNKRLLSAEQKIEILIKNRSGAIETDSKGDPLKAPFEGEN